MPRHSDHGTREVWRQRFQRFATSGVPVARFCAREGVSVASFYNWRKKLASNGTRRRTAGGRSSLRSRPALPGPSFQAVTVVPSVPEVCIHLPGGARIEVRGDDLDTVRAVVAEVADFRPRLHGTLERLRL
jgi:hypothetical protein